MVDRDISHTMIYEIIVERKHYAKFRKEMEEHVELKSDIPDIPQRLQDQDFIELQIRVTFVGKRNGEVMVSEIFRAFHVNIKEQNRIGAPSKTREFLHQVKQKIWFLILSYITTLLIQTIYNFKTLTFESVSHIALLSLLIILIPIHRDVLNYVTPAKDSANI